MAVLKSWNRPSYMKPAVQPVTKPQPTKLGDYTPQSTTPTKLGNMKTTATVTNYAQPTATATGNQNITSTSGSGGFSAPNPLPKGTGNATVDKEIARKASNGIALTDPKYQDIYDQYQTYLTNEIRRKAGLGQQLTDSTPWKDSIYQSFLPKQTTPNQPTTPSTPTAPSGNPVQQMPQRDFMKEYMDQISSAYERQQQAALERFKSQRDQAVGQINQQKTELAPQYANMRNQADVVNAQNVAKLREIMASQGLTGSGENVTGLVALGSARQGALNQLNTQEQQQRNDYDRRIADLNNPSELNAMQAALDAEKMRAMADAMRYGDERSYQRERDSVMDGRYDQEWNYQKERDAVSDKRYDDEWAYQQQRDKVGDEQWNKQFKSQEEARKAEQAWREYTFKNMSASEKRNFEIMEKQFGEEQAWKYYQMNYQGELEKSLAQSEIDAFKNAGFNSGEGGGGYTRKASGSPNQSYSNHLNTAIASGAIPKEWAGALTELVGRESSWNPKAKNPNSTAHGYGQFLNSTRSNYEKKMGLDYDNPVHQLIMMAQYIKDRYGSPQKALAFWDSNKWY